MEENMFLRQWILLTLMLFSPLTWADAVIGTGTATSCTETALRAAFAIGGTLSFNCGNAPATISINSELLISKDTLIDGGGTQQGGLITLDGGKRTRILRSDNNLKVTLKNLTLKNGQQTGSDGSGSGIYFGNFNTASVFNCIFENNDGTAGNQERGGGAIATKSLGSLVVTDSLFRNNRGINGGAINHLLGNLTVTRSVFLNNDSTPGGSNAGDTRGYGGAIYVDGASAPNDSTGGTIQISHSQFRNNKGAGQGGGLFLFGYPPDKIIIDNSAITDNTVLKSSNGDALGGGLRVGNADLTIENVLFANNRAYSQGGGLWIGETTPTRLLNSTFYNNRAEESAGSGLGGAILYSTQSEGSFTNLTLANNYAGFMGGAFWGNADKVTLRNSIVSNNKGDNPWNINWQVGASLKDGGNNLEFPAPSTQDPKDVKVVANSRVLDPLLASLNENGGASATLALLANSPAINGGTNCPTTDQRGVKRTQCDIGAFAMRSFNSGAFDLSAQTPISRGSTASFTPLVSSGTQQGNNLVIKRNQSINVSTNVSSDAADVGRTVYVVIVANYAGQWFVRNNQTWTAWDGQLANLKAAEVRMALNAEEKIAVFDGNVQGFTGNYTVYVGYLIPQTLKLVFNQNEPLRFTVAE
jgi:hypothetical protein